MTKRHPSTPRPTDAQQRLIDELEAAGRDHAQLEIIRCESAGEGLVAQLRLTTADIGREPGGIPLEHTEDIFVNFHQWYPWSPPLVQVPHERWAKHAHVLVGSRLCVYLDPSREWSPAHGVIGFLDRLWRWLEDAAANRFDPRVALYHPVGGVLHRTPGSPTLVVSDVADHWEPGIRHAALAERTAVRLDVAGWNRKAGDGELPCLVIVLNGPLVYGAGTTVGELLRRIAPIGFPTVDAVRSLLHRAVRRCGPGEFVHVLVAGRHKALTGDGQYHLLCCRFVCSETDPVLAETTSPSTVPDGPELEWLHVDDCRAAVTTRRDVSRPVDWFHGRTVELWGCGALGSWIGENLVRAGVATLILRDPSPVTHGLLVRQNFTETDVGRNKAEALAARLRAISDTTTVIPHAAQGEQALADDGGHTQLPKVDLIIDATVNMSVATMLNMSLAAGPATCHVAQITTDVSSATLGLLAVVAEGHHYQLGELDNYTRTVVLENPGLEGYLCLWDDEPPDEIVPTVGCSVPTFRGSAADAAAVAACAVSLLGLTLAAGASGTHLFSLPYSPHAVLTTHWTSADDATSRS